MKVLFPVFCLICFNHTLSSQTARTQSEPLKVEWQIEFPVGETGVSGLVLRNERIYLTQTGGASVFNILDSQGAMTFSSLANNTRIRSLFIYDGFIYSMGDQHLTKRDFDGSILEEYMLPRLENGYISSRNGKILNGRAYTTHVHNDFLKFSMNGEQLFRKEIGTLTDNHFLDVGGNYIYVYSAITNPAQGSRLMQYDTLGNQKWSVGVGMFVSNMVADNLGNTFLFGGIGGKCYVQKYNSEGTQVWSSYTDGISYLNGVVHGDSLFVCGGVTTEKPYDQITDDDRQGAWALYSVKSGERMLNQTYNLYPGEGYPERFRQIAFDKNTGNVYLGGSFGQEGNGAMCILVKLSREGNTTGLKETTTSSNFSIFPNPGGSQFTIACENAKSGTLKVTVRNTLGQIVKKKEINCDGQKSFEFDLGKQVAGNYTVEIVSATEKVVKKVVVE